MVEHVREREGTCREREYCRHVQAPRRLWVVKASGRSRGWGGGIIKGRKREISLEMRRL